MALFFSVLLCACAGVFSFNVDIPSRVVYKGNQNSMFGFTVQSHVDGDRKMILVGAPEDEPYQVTGVTRPGAVYKCQPGARGYEDRRRPLDMCSVMVFDKNQVNNVDRSQRQIDEKSNQWFGATLSSTGRNGPIVACAPRYVSYVSAKLNQRDPVGSCFVAKSSDAAEVNEFSPCRTSSHGQRKTGMCQAGFSGAISKDGQRLFLGAPGSWYWQGQLMSSSLANKPSLIATAEASPKYDDSYMGYSVTVGDFAGQGIQGVAVGVPRGSDLKGLVVLYTWELQNIKNISGSQIGAYFGYSIASGDIDGDGADDVIVGAPMFTRPKTNGFEHGRIYVIYQGVDRSFSKNHARTGDVSRGRFGLAVTSLGDINYDGFGDIAVGAPYGGEDGRGVVYIYHGSETGLREKHSQAITAEEISPTLTTFGFSLSGGVDLDNNNYTDLAVGAYKSDSVVFLKARPVVKVMADVKFMGESKLISLDDKRCRLTNGTKVACAQLMFCLTYDGVNVDQQINFEVILELDSRMKTRKRIFLLESRETTYTTHILLTQGRQECKDITVYLDEEIRDKLTPIEVKMTYELMTQPSGSVVPPVLDQTRTIEHTDSLNIQKNCGSDNICIPDMRLAVTTPTVNYVLGSGENLNLDVKVENLGEDAFEAAYYLQIPAGVTYAKMERLDKNVEATPIYCSIKKKDVSGNSTLKCDLGNPMESGQKVYFRVVLEVDSAVRGLSLYTEANSTNPEHDTQYDNTMHLNIGVVVKAQLSVIGTSDPPELHYNASLYETDNLKDDTKLGPQVIHKYNIKNEGPFTVDEAEIYIMWPYETLAGEGLMYMLVQPQSAGNIQCDVARHVNPDNLFVQNPYANLLIKENEAMATSEFYSASHVSGGNGYNRQSSWEQRNSGGQFHGQVNGGHTASTENRYGQTGGTRVTGSQSFGSQSSGGYNGQTGGHVSGGHSYNKSWSNEFGEGFNAEEEENIRRNINLAASGNVYRGTSNQGILREIPEDQSSYGHVSNSQEVYGQGSQSYGQDQVYKQGGQGGFNQGEGRFVKIKNRTVLYDEHHNIISQTETSTEYGSLGHEGEAGSSFNKYNNRGGAFQQSSQSGSGGSQGFVHGSWSTTETVNPAVQRASSTTFHEQGLTVVGDEEEDQLEGFGAYAAQNQNNQFRYGIGDVSGGFSQSGGQGRGSAQSGGARFSQSGGAQYSQSGARSGGISQTGVRTQSGGYQGSRSGSIETSGGGGGYSYSSRSGGQSSYSTHIDGGYGSEQQRRESTRRRRREVQVDPELKGILEKCEEKFKCSVVRCSAGPLLKGQEVWVALRARINATVINEISRERSVKLSSLAASRVSRLPLVGAGDKHWSTTEAHTLVTPQLEALESGAIPLWVVVLAAVVGTLLLLLLIFALYKCGFFKRNRPSDHTERQPLNGRDEHL